MEIVNRLNMSRLDRYSAWIALGVFIVVILVSFPSLFSLDLSSSPGEPNWSMEYNWSEEVAKGSNIYPQEPTFIEGSSLAYMPLYFVVVGGLMTVFGTSALVGSIVSTLAVLGVALIIYKIGVKLTGRRLVSIIPGSLFLLFPQISIYSSEQMKVDPLALLLSTISLYLVLNRQYLRSVPFAVLAFFTKQSFIAIPIAVVIYLVWKERSKLRGYLGVYGILLGLGFGLGQYLTGGTFFTHVVVFLFDPQFGEIVLGRTIMGNLIVLGYLVPVLVLAGYGMKRSKVFGFLGTYLVVSLLIMVVIIGKVGSGINYVFEPLVVACCLSALVLGRSREKFRQETRYG